jgi:hypothetical protein
MSATIAGVPLRGSSMPLFDLCRRASSGPCPRRTRTHVLDCTHTQRATHPRACTHGPGTPDAIGSSALALGVAAAARSSDSQWLAQSQAAAGVGSHGPLRPNPTSADRAAVGRPDGPALRR